MHVRSEEDSYDFGVWLVYQKDRAMLSIDTSALLSNARISYYNIKFSHLLIGHCNGFVNLGHCVAGQFGWLIYVYLAASRLKVNKGVTIGQLIANLQVVGQVVLDFKEFDISRVLCEVQNGVLRLEKGVMRIRAE